MAGRFWFSRRENQWSMLLFLLVLVPFHQFVRFDAQFDLILIQVDLVGGYYDAGDNVKFGLPMAFTITMMSWSIIEYGNQMSAMGELLHAIDAVKWGTDYLIKAHPQPYVLYGEVIH